jgi:hypothetical protein
VTVPRQGMSDAFVSPITKRTDSKYGPRYDDRGTARTISRSQSSKSDSRTSERRFSTLIHRQRLLGIIDRAHDRCSYPEGLDGEGKMMMIQYALLYHSRQNYLRRSGVYHTASTLRHIQQIGRQLRSHTNPARNITISARRCTGQ